MPEILCFGNAIIHHIIKFNCNLSLSFGFVNKIIQSHTQKKYQNIYQYKHIRNLEKYHKLTRNNKSQTRKTCISQKIPEITSEMPQNSPMSQNRQDPFSNTSKGTQDSLFQQRLMYEE
ncbi:hypothetical protein CsSME_00022222 [Camellia sinensis var. sinensis]